MPSSVHSEIAVKHHVCLSIYRSIVLSIILSFYRLNFKITFSHHWSSLQCWQIRNYSNLL